MVGQAEVQPQRKKWPMRIGIAAAIVVALLVGVGIGAASNAKTSQLNADKSAITGLHGQVGSLHGQVSSLQSQLSEAKSKASNAVAIAEAKVAAADKAKEAGLSSEAATLKSQQATINNEVGELAANQISASGVYVVGKDMKNGTWHTPGDGGQNDNACYYATLNSTNTSDISDNNNFDGPETVSLAGVDAFEISGPCTWYLVP
jgi:outer membrane murein-binding lipoprotein Lpp